MIDNNNVIKKLDVNIQFIYVYIFFLIMSYYLIITFDSRLLYRKSDVHSFQGMMTEKELKISLMFSLFHEVFNSDKIKNAW